MNASAAEGADHFVAKWHRREPEMALAEVFCPVPLRPRFRAWGAMLHELREAAFELSDARVTAVKSQWWADELLRLAQGQGRHPISADLPFPELPWPRLARGLIEQSLADTRPADTGAAIARMRPLAEALAELEAGLFDAAAAPDQAIAIHLLLQRLPLGLASDDQAGIPMNLLARHGTTAGQVAAGEGEPLLRDWAGELLSALPPLPAGAPLFRRLRLRFDRARLQRLAAGKGFDPPPAPASLWRAWGIARRT
jgi:phytoene/squalene synthetase